MSLAQITDLRRHPTPLPLGLVASYIAPQMPAFAAPEPPPLDNRRRRLIFRAQHRGTHETDLLIGGFLTPLIATMTNAELDEIEAVMEHPDTDLADWLTGRRPIPAAADTPMLRRIRAAALAGTHSTAVKPRS